MKIKENDETSKKVSFFMFTNFHKHDETYVGMGVRITKFSVEYSAVRSGRSLRNFGMYIGTVPEIPISLV
jgi:hypothetical protein